MEKRIRYPIFAIFIGIIQALVTFPLQVLIPLLKGLIVGVLDIMVFSFILMWLSPLSFISSLKIIVVTKVIFILISDLKLMRQTTLTTFFSVIDRIRLLTIFGVYIKQGEKYNASPKILVNGKPYVVIEFGTYLKPTEEDKITGFLILNYDTGEVIQNEGLLRDILKVYKCWRHIYFKPVLGKTVSRKNIPFIKNWIKFQDMFKKIIEKRKNDNYKQVTEVRDYEFIKILKVLDDEVINQYPFIIKKLKTELTILNNLYVLFSKPSLEFYQEFMDDIEIIAKMSNEENKIWMHRLRTWESLYQYKKLKIEKMPDSGFENIKLGIIGDLVNYFILKQQLYPIGGATIAGFAVDGNKKIKKSTLRFLNKYLLYHHAGIKAIKKNIEFNSELKKVRDDYKQIWKNINLSKVRNLEKLDS